MEMLLLAVILFFVLIVLALQFWPSKCSSGSIDLKPLERQLDAVQSSQERTDRSVCDGIAKFRAESQTRARQEREELAGSLKSFGDSVEQKMEALLSVSVALIVHSFGNI
jgi:HAMP domain-containing protein